MISVKPELERIFQEIADERVRQDRLHPNVGLPLFGKNEGESPPASLVTPTKSWLQSAIDKCRAKQRRGTVGYFDVMLEEVCEAFLEEDREAQIAEFIQVAAVAVRIVEGLREGKIK
jgi:hypothetical protein